MKTRGAAPFTTPLTLVWFALLAFLTNPAQAQGPRARVEFDLNRTAKILCSGVFVSGRDVGETLLNSARRVLQEADWQLLASRAEGGKAAIIVDRDTGLVTVGLRGHTARARYYGDQGCSLLPPGYDDVLFEPVTLRTTLPDADTQTWPMGDVVSGELPAGVDPGKVQEAVDAAFEGEGLTTALVVVYKGQIIAERYGQGADKHTQLESWSMGKSLTATLVGILVQQGYLTLDEPAPVEAWHRDAEDPRGKITVRDLMRMSSGLRFTHASQPAHEWGREIPDHLFVYSAATDVFKLSITRPAEFPPNTVGRYRNSDPLTLGYIIRQKVEELGESYLAWPQKALFDRIGIRKQILEPDLYGNLILTGYDFGTGRNWARIGMLYLQDGVWQGERLLPEGWADFVGAWAPAWERPVYGGLFWVNGEGRWNVPYSAYYMSGAGGQHVIIVPTHDLVVARLGHSRGQREGAAALNRALALLMEAIEPDTGDSREIWPDGIGFSPLVR